MEWTTVKYQNTQQSGPVEAMEQLMHYLDNQGIDYSVETLEVPIADAVDAEDNG